MPLDHAESKAIIAFDKQMFDDDFHICADVEILFGSNQRKGLGSFLYGLLPVALASSLVCCCVTMCRWQVWCVLLLACVRPFGIRKGPGWSQQRAQGRKGKRTRGGGGK